MSLIVALDINRIGAGAGFITVQRISGSDDPASVNRYVYMVQNGEGAVVATGDVEHRYGAGSLALLAAVCREADL